MLACRSAAFLRWGRTPRHLRAQGAQLADSADISPAAPFRLSDGIGVCPSDLDVCCLAAHLTYGRGYIASDGWCDGRHDDQRALWMPGTHNREPRSALSPSPGDGYDQQSCADASERSESGSAEGIAGRIGCTKWGRIRKSCG